MGRDNGRGVVGDVCPSVRPSVCHRRMKQIVRERINDDDNRHPPDARCIGGFLGSIESLKYPA